jgi:predicted transcriptional regulator
LYVFCKQNSNHSQQLSLLEKQRKVFREVMAVHDHLSELNADGLHLAMELNDCALEQAGDVEVDWGK